MAERQDLGRAGEAAVTQRYCDDGYEVIATNWHDGRRGELDLVVRKGSLVVAVEVKTRRSSAFGDPLEQITTAKQQRLRRLLFAWVREARADGVSGIDDLRVDVAVVRWAASGPAEIEIVEDAC
jgi:putative endonuclease